MPARPKVFATRRIPEAGLEILRSACDLEVWPEPLPPPYDHIRAKAADCDGLVTLLTDRVDGALLDAAPRVKVISNYAVGFNNVDVPAMTARGVCVGNTPGVLTDATADMALTLLLAASRRLGEACADAKAGRWHTWEPLGWLGQDLAGRTLGVVGMGRIGFALAKRCRGAFDMHILYADAIANEKAERELGARKVELDQLLAESDFVSMHANLDASTKGLFNAARFAQMKRTAVFVNSARGGHVDQKALYDALKNGTIFAAGLDVTEPEPLPPNDPLYSLPNCIVAPHIASATIGTRDAMARICADNLLAGLRGEPLPAWVNPEVADKRRR